MKDEKEHIVNDIWLLHGDTEWLADKINVCAKKA